MSLHLPAYFEVRYSHVNWFDKKEKKTKNKNGESKLYASLPDRSFKSQHVTGSFLAVPETGNALCVRYSLK